ncbi:MAG: hypothetical protein ABJA98_06505 [Acidobacteriota bacterium]
MAQFHYCGTWVDSADLVEALLDGERIEILCAPGISDTPELVSFNSWSAKLEEHLRKNPQAFLRGPFTRSRVGFLHYDEGPFAGKYVADISHGGPVLGFSVASSFERNDRFDLGPGTLWYQPRYLDLEAGEWKPPSQELKAAYKSLVQRARSRLLRHKLPDGVTIEIGREALDLFKAGKAHVRWMGIDYDSDPP